MKPYQATAIKQIGTILLGTMVITLQTLQSEKTMFEKWNAISDQISKSMKEAQKIEPDINPAFWEAAFTLAITGEFGPEEVLRNALAETALGDAMANCQCDKCKQRRDKDANPEETKEFVIGGMKISVIGLSPESDIGELLKRIFR